MSKKHLLLLFLGCFLLLYQERTILLNLKEIIRFKLIERDLAEGKIAGEALPSWMLEQIHRDLSRFSSGIQSEMLDAVFDLEEKEQADWGLIRYRIKDGLVRRVRYQSHLKKSRRFHSITQALKTLSRKVTLPDIEFIVSIADNLDVVDLPGPVFAFAKKQSSSAILMPDFEALEGQYQVLPHLDTREIPWEGKVASLIWRGSTAQGIVTPEHVESLSRVKLCKLSEQFPELIDSKFTIFCQGGEDIPELQHFAGTKISYEEMSRHKFQFWIDGNTASYSASGWRFFINSVVIKPMSENVQWYYGGLQPYVHFVPVEANLSNLVATLEWLKANDSVAKEIARHAVTFARESLTVEANMRYLKALFWEYHEFIQ